MRIAFLALVAAVVGAAVAVGGGAAPEQTHLVLAATPSGLVERCEGLSPRKHVTVLCPRRLAAPASGADVRPGRALCRPSRAYMLEYALGSFRVLVGGGGRAFRLDGSPPGGARALDVRSGGRVLARTTVHKAPAAVLAAPVGGLHSGNVLVLWNEGGAGYVVSLGGPADRRELARAALGIARETRRSRLEPDTPARAVIRATPANALGRSAGGRPIPGIRVGMPGARRRIALFGCIHGDECAGIRIVERALETCPGGDYDLLAVPNLNPDGRRLGTRLNRRGVDLNRNFGSAWRPIGRRGDPEHSGPRPFSEPETRVAARAIRSFRPDVTIWFHQHRGTPLVRAWGGSVAVARRYARYAGVPFRALPWLAGTAPNWQNHRFRGTSSFVVELPFGPVSRAVVSHHVQAILRLASERR